MRQVSVVCTQHEYGLLCRICGYRVSAGEIAWAVRSGEGYKWEFHWGEADLERSGWQKDYMVMASCDHWKGIIHLRMNIRGILFTGEECFSWFRRSWNELLMKRAQVRHFPHHHIISILFLCVFTKAFGIYETMIYATVRSNETFEQRSDGILGTWIDHKETTMGRHYFLFRPDL